MKKSLQDIFDVIKQLDDYIAFYKRQAKVISLPSIAYVNWGIELLKIGLADDALKKFETSALMAYPDLEAFTNLALLNLRDKKFEEAKRYLEQALKLDKENSKIYCMFGALYNELKEYKIADKYFKKAHQLMPRSPEVNINWGISFAKQNKKVEAREKFLKAFELDPTNPQSLFLAAIAEMELQNFDKAIEKFDIVLTFNYLSAEVLYYKSLCYLKLNDLDKALLVANKSSQLAPYKYEPILIQAEIAFKQNKEKECEELYQKALSLNAPQLQVYHDWGLSLQKFMEFERSNQMLDRVLELVPNHQSAIYIKSLNYINLKDIDKAYEQLLLLISLNPNHTDALYRLGLIYYEKKDYSKAITTLFAAQKTSRKTEYMFFDIANCYLEKKELEQAAYYYKETLKYDETNVSAMLNYANIMVDLKNYQEAKRKMRTAFLQNRKNPKIIFLYALILFRCNEYQDALAKFEQTLELDSNYTSARWGIAECLIKLNKVNEAIKYLQTLNENLHIDIKFLTLNLLAYFKLAQQIPSYYNIKTAISYCDKILEITPDDEVILQHKNCLQQLLQQI